MPEKEPGKSESPEIPDKLEQVRQLAERLERLSQAFKERGGIHQEVARTLELAYRSLGQITDRYSEEDIEYAIKYAMYSVEDAKRHIEFEKNSLDRDLKEIESAVKEKN